jgi:3-oxoacyl-[acyl-carrier protein] reductase
MNQITVRRTALVTGGSRGLGRAIAVKLGGSGMDVAVNYFNGSSGAEAACSEIRTHGSRAVAIKADVRSESEVANLVRQTKDTLGEIEVLVVNATGPQPMLPIEEQSWQSYLDQLEFFVKSPLLLVKQVLDSMREKKFGRIIQIGSEVFELGNPRFANYVAAKGAQLGQTRSWAMELADTGITVNLVAPGWIPTERHEGTPQAEMDEYIKKLPTKKMGLPVDVATAVAFLASDEASFITGQKISVNGGNTVS